MRRHRVAAGLGTKVIQDQQEALMEKRMDQPEAMIAGRIGEVDGQKVIYTDSVELR